MLHLHHANRLEDLAEALRRNLQTALSEALKPEIIAVPGTAMSEWLTIHLAATGTHQTFQQVLQIIVASSPPKSHEMLFGALAS